MARHALLIGVSRFEDKRLAKLNAPTGDVEAFGAVLRDPERGGFSSVEISIDDDYLAVRDRMTSLFEDRDPGDLLLLYYSGHGILGRSNRLFLATPGSNLERPQARSLSSGELREMMDQTRAEQQVVGPDCCHSGAFAEGSKGVATTAVTEATFAATVGRYVLAAAAAQQFAWDGSNLREGSPVDRKLSRFTSWLVDGLGNGQAAPDDEQITMDAVFRYVCQRAKAEGSPSTPQRYVDRGTGDVVIARNPTAGSAWQELLAKLRADDWNVRMATAAEMGRLSRKSGPMADSAREALLDQLGEERDYQVRSVLFRMLGLEQKRQPEPKVVPEARGDQYLLVTFPEDRDVLADGDRVGVTNHICLLPANEYTITLSGTDYVPPMMDALVVGTSLMRPRIIHFSTALARKRRDKRQERQLAPKAVPEAKGDQYLIVTFPADRDVLADGDRVGVTNHTILIPANEYTITLSGPSVPPSRNVMVAGTSIMRPMVIEFAAR